MMDLKLKDKVVLVTGAAQGIGLAVARGFAAEGAKLVLNDLNADALRAASAELGGAAISIGDVGMREGVEVTVAAALAAHGRIDVLVNNAGISNRASRIEDVSDADWRKVFAVNLDSAFMMCRAAMESLRSSGGTIVNVASLSGQRGSIIGNNLAYSAAKAAVIGLTVALAGEAAASGVRVNGVAPGPTETPHMRDVSPENHAMLVRMTPLGRLAQAEDIADLILFLASGRSRHITGEIVNINGGIYYG